MLTYYLRKYKFLKTKDFLVRLYWYLGKLKECPLGHNLSFMSKVVERAVISQLTEYLSANDLLPCLQSAYRKSHSTETAMLRVWSDELMTADVQQVTLLAMLDLSAAFDCVDHTILLQRLQVGAGLTNVVLQWISSFLSERTQQVAYNGELSTV